MLGLFGKSVAKPIRYGQIALKSSCSFFSRSITVAKMSTAFLRRVPTLKIPPLQRAIASSNMLFRQDQSRFRNMFLFILTLKEQYLYASYPLCGSTTI